MTCNTPIIPTCPRCGSQDVEPHFDYLGPDPNDMDGEKWGETDAMDCNECDHQFLLSTPTIGRWAG